jgi:hypothetical protein
MGIKFSNGAVSTLFSAIGVSDTTITLAAGGGGYFPALGAGDYFYAVIALSQSSKEIVKVTARSGDVLTVVRAQEGTLAQIFAQGTAIELRLTSAALTDPSLVTTALGYTPAELDAFGNLLVGTDVQLQSARASIADSLPKTSSSNLLVFGTASGGTDDFQLVFGRSAAGTNAYYSIQSVEQNTAYRDLVLQANGGDVSIGYTAGTGKLNVNGHINILGGTFSYAAGSDTAYGNGPGCAVTAGATGAPATFVGFWWQLGASNQARLFVGNTGATSWINPMTVGTDGTVSLTGGVVTAGVNYMYQPAQTSKSAAATLTAAELLTGIIQYTGAAATLTLPTATAIDSGINAAAALTNSAFEVVVINTGSGTATVAVGTGITAVGLLTVATSTSARFRFRKTGTAAYTVFRIG